MTDTSEDVFVVPASSGQQRLWFLDQSLDMGAAYNMYQAYRLRGPVAEGRLAQSLDTVVARHESLRTAFRMVSGELRQVIWPALSVPLQVVDLKSTELATPERLDTVLREEAQRPFDLAEAPLMRATLFRLANQDSVLSIVIHHIVVDGWSMRVLLEELSEVYRTLARGDVPSLLTLPLQFADFALWERERVQNASFDSGLAFWRDRLAGELPMLEVPSKAPRSSVPSYRGHSLAFRMSRDLTARVNETSRAAGGSFFIAALTALAAVLSRYTGQDDVLIGGPIGNRLRPELETAVGFFANTVVFRADLTDNPTFRELFRRVRHMALEVYAHQDTPFDLVVRSVHPDRATDRNPLFQVALAYQLQPDVMLALSDLDVEPIVFHNGTSKFDLLIDLQERSTHVDGVIELSADLFDEATANRLRAHFLNALESLAGQPDRRVSDFPMLSASERSQAIHGWNPRAVYQVTTTVHERFEQRAGARPDDLAVECGAEVCTYRELNRRANQLAVRLRAMGVSPDDLVALHIEPSIDLIVGMLGILKSGGAYLPLDVSYPLERLAFTIADARVRAVVTTAPLAVAMKCGAIPVVRLDSDRAALDVLAGDNAPSLAGPDHRAYVIYTSGSTGQPKGVEVTHANVVRLFDATDEWFHFGASDVWTLFHSAAFDFSVWEIWGALLYGGRLVVVPYEVSRSPVEFHALLRCAGVTVLNQTPSGFRQLIDADQMLGATGPLVLRAVILGGEALDLASLAPWFAKYGDRVPRIINMYGITETTVHVTYRPITSEDVARSAGSVIGQPIPDLQIYLLDRYQQLVPVGIPGEMYVGGAGVARGYLNRPALTAERFIADAFSSSPTARQYRSGDLAKRLANGDLEYLGRIDQQVKIRGFRIELGEIESVVGSHPKIQQAVVLAREDAPGDKRLVAYVVPVGAGDVSEVSGDVDADQEQVSEWQAVFERTYAQPQVHDDSTFDVSGWNSSFTRAPIPAEEMREWLDHGVARILERKPRRMWEIGCGTGLILHRVAPQCLEYLGTDMVASAVDRLGTQGLGARVRVVRRAAHEGSGVPAQRFDSVVLNSVVQYFPSVEYLLRVLEQAIDAVEDGGTIFVGDIRSLPLLEAFHVSVEAYRAEPSVSVSELAERVRRALAQEEELLLAPAFFDALPRQYARVTAVDIDVKRGRHHNEMTAFRYDVRLSVGGGHARPEATESLDWIDDRLSPGLLRERLRDRQLSISIRDVPNRRVAMPVRMGALLRDAPQATTVAELQLEAASGCADAIDPEAIWALADELGYQAALTWSASGRADTLDVRLWHPSHHRAAVLPPLHAHPVEARPDASFWRQVASHPVAAVFARRVVPGLRRHLEEHLPAHMIPWAFVPLDRLPLTSNGKLDRRALPPPLAVSSHVGSYVGPRDQLERELAQIWTEVLSLPKIGVHDDFFDLGGHSILVARVTARVRTAFGVDLSFAEMFSASTLEQLAAVIRPRIDSTREKAAPITRAPRGVRPSRPVGDSAPTRA